MVITSRQNPKAALMRSLMHSRKTRQEAGLFAVEGEKLFREAVSSGLKPENLMLTENYYKSNAKFSEYAAGLCNIDIICDVLAEYISDTRSPQGVFFTLRLLDKSENIATIYNSPRIIALDNLQDPGNVGAIIRSADAFGIDALMLSGNCADIHSPKVIRSAMGSAFRLPMFVGALTELKDKGYVIIGAAIAEDAEPLGSFGFPEKCAVVIGSEGAGLSTEARALCDRQVYIPIRNAESLNAAVAAAIIIYEMEKGE